MSATFGESTYLSQVRQLRKLAHQALALYPIRADKLEFIRHGENATFKVTTKTQNRYLLRIHRGGYHSSEAILEELKWLAQLSGQTGLKVPKPVSSKKGRLLERISSDRFPEGRDFEVFEWIEGRHLIGQPSSRQMYKIGELIAKLHANQPKKPIQHRKYWLSDGLVGTKPKFGTIDRIVGLTPSQQKTLTAGRKIALSHLKKYERKHPERRGLVHADIHFGNILWSAGEPSAIDFDDCGIGFFAYDIATILFSTHYRLGDNSSRYWPRLKAALLEGYTQTTAWDDADEAILKHMMTAREMMAVAWMNSRSDNPRLKARLKPLVGRVIQRIKKEYGI